MIEIKNITKSFGSVKSLDDVTFSVPDGSVFGLIGSNGSGKSTLMRVVAGTYKEDCGEILVDNGRVWENPAMKEKVVYLSDEQFFVQYCTMSDMARLYASVYPAFDKRRFIELAIMFGLDTSRKVNSFSKGMQKQISVILGLSSGAKYLLCDETFDGLDPVMRQLVKRLFAEAIAEKNMTIMIASHNLRELEDICDHVALLHKGKLLFEHELDDMKLNIFKIQAVFGDGVDPKSVEGLDVISSERLGSVYTMIVRGTQDEITGKLSQLSPSLLEFIPLTLEEIFITEMEDRGYDSSKIIF